MESHLILVFLSTVLVTAVLGQGAHLKNIHDDMISNNSHLDYTNDIGIGGSTLRCVTKRVDCCSFDNKTRVDWFTPSGEVVDDMYFIRVWKGLGSGEGSVHIFRISSTSVASVQEGLYHCNIPAPNGDINTLYVGIYVRDIDTLETRKGIPTISGITYNQLSPEMFTLTCISTDGPATYVTWTLNGSVITHDANHVLTQTVVNTITAEYNNTLTVTGREPGIYQCTVSNARGSGTSQKLLVVNNTGITASTPPSYTFSLIMEQLSTTPKPSTTTTPSQSTPSAGTPDPSSSSQLPVAIAGAAAGLILCIILIVVLILALTVYKRRKGNWPWGKKPQHKYDLQQIDDTRSSVNQHQTNSLIGQTLTTQPPITMEGLDPSYSLLSYHESDQGKKKKSTNNGDSCSTIQEKQTNEITAEDEPKTSSGPGDVYAVVDKPKKLKYSVQSESRANPITMETVGPAETNDVYAVVQKKVKKKNEPPPLPAPYQEELYTVGNA